VRVCAVCLARAHARTGDAVAISGYIGKGSSLAKAIADFTAAYADQTEQDHQSLVETIESGRVEAKTGI
jgi:predicted alpha/beta hydrolase